MVAEPREVEPMAEGQTLDTIAGIPRDYYARDARTLTREPDGSVTLTFRRLRRLGRRAARMMLRGDERRAERMVKRASREGR